MIIIKYISMIGLCIFSLSVLADVNVKGYQRSDGTYVQPHQRSNPNNSTNDNWSTKGNSNPYTGERGTNDRSGW